MLVRAEGGALIIGTAAVAATAVHYERWDASQWLYFPAANGRIWDNLAGSRQGEPATTHRPRRGRGERGIRRRPPAKARSGGDPSCSRICLHAGGSMWRCRDWLWCYDHDGTGTTKWECQACEVAI